MSTRTSSLSMRTTLPVTTSPSSKGVIVAASLGTTCPSISSRRPSEPSTTLASVGVSVAVAMSPHRVAATYTRAMPKRATKRGADRTRLDLDADVLICGASFAGLAVARELAGSGASVLIADRYEVGERQTSACAAPTTWLHALGLQESIQQTFGGLLCHPPRGDVRWRLPWTFSTFDYRTLCTLLFAQTHAHFENAKV